MVTLSAGVGRKTADKARGHGKPGFDGVTARKQAGFICPRQDAFCGFEGGFARPDSASALAPRGKSVLAAIMPLPPGPRSDESFLREAIALARAGSASGVGGPFGAILVQGGLIVGRGQNRVTSTYDPTAHAEVVAIRAACAAQRQFHLSGATLYTSCEPCPMCLAAAYWARVERIVYAGTRDDAAAIGFDDAVLYRELALGLGERRVPMVPLLRAEGVAVFREWEHNPQRIPY